MNGEIKITKGMKLLYVVYRFKKYLMEDSHEVLANVEARFFDHLNEAYGWLESLGVFKD